MIEDEPELYRGYTANQLRTLLPSGGLPPSMLPEAIKWLGEQERREAVRTQEERERMEASSSEQIRLSRESNVTARQVKSIAIATLIVAIIGSIAAILALFIH